MAHAHPAGSSDRPRIEVDPSLGEEASNYLILAASDIAEEFKVEPFPTPLRVIRAPSPGLPPQYRPELIIVTANANASQIRLQLGHEAFHWLCSPDYLYHWVHEMFAMEMSVRQLRKSGFPIYADECDADFRAGAKSFSVEQMIAESISPPYPYGLHDRAYLVGKELTEAVGWDRLKPLATKFDSKGQPDVADWLADLRPAEQAAVRQVLDP